MVSSCVAPRNYFTRFSLVGSIKKKIVDFPSPLCAFSIEISHPLDTSSACDQLLPHEIHLFFARPLSTEEGQSGGISIRRLLSIRPSFLTLERPSCEPVTITRSRRLDDDEDNEMLRECPFCGHFGSVSSSFGRFQSADFNNLNPSAFLMFWTVLPFVSPPQIIFGLLFLPISREGKMLNDAFCLRFAASVFPAAVPTSAASRRRISSVVGIRSTQFGRIQRSVHAQHDPPEPLFISSDSTHSRSPPPRRT